MDRVLRVTGMLIGLLLALPAAAEPAPAEARWHLVSDKNGIQVYRQQDSARIATFRGVTRFPLAHPNAIEGLLNDYPAIPRWMHFISRGDEISRTDYLHRKLRFTTELPWPISDRDVVADFTVQQVSPTHMRITAIDDPQAAVTDNFVRIPDLNGRLEFHYFPETKEVEATYEIVMDPGGNIPGWAANIVLKDTPYFTLLKLRRLVADPKYRDYQSPAIQYPW